VGIFSTYPENLVRTSGKVGRAIYLRELTRDSFSISAGTRFLHRFPLLWNNSAVNCSIRSTD